MLDTQEVRGSNPLRPTPCSPRNSAGGYVFDRKFDRKAAIDRVGGVLAQRIGDMLVAAQHPQVLVAEHVEDDRGGHALGEQERGSRVAQGVEGDGADPSQLALPT